VIHTGVLEFLPWWLLSIIFGRDAVHLLFGESIIRPLCHCVYILGLKLLFPNVEGTIGRVKKQVNNDGGALDTPLAQPYNAVTLNVNTEYLF